MRKPDWVIVAGTIFILIGFNFALTGLFYTTNSSSVVPGIIVFDSNIEHQVIEYEFQIVYQEVNLTFDNDLNIKFLSFAFIVIGLWLIAVIGFNYKDFLLKRN